MSSFSFASGRCYVDGQATFLTSAEFQYFRTPREQWLGVLRRLQQAHCNCVSTYVPWNWHEPCQGMFDFDGTTHPCRDLLGFLRLIREAGLFLLVKVGPFIHNEWRNGGIPNWLTDGHPEILALGPDGNASAYQSYPPLSYLHPVLMQFIRLWLIRAATVLKGEQNILLWQVDNEISYSYTFMNGTGLMNDYHPHLIQDGWYQQFLVSHFSNDLDALNRRYASSYTTFAAVEPPRESPRDSHETLRVYDWIAFKEWLATRYLKSCCDILHAAGACGPFILNAPFHGCFSLWRNLVLKLNGGPYRVFVTHCDYPGPIKETTIGEVIGRTEFCKSAQDDFWGNNEIQACNVAQRWGCYGTTHDLLFKLVAGSGLSMINYYWFCDGENPLDYGEYSDRHEYCAPLARDGSLRPHYPLIRNLNRALLANPAWLPLEKVYHTSLGYLHAFHRMSIFKNTLGVGTLWELDRLCNLMALSNISFKVVNLEEPENENTGTLVVPTPSFMPRSVQQALLDYASAGGHLILLGRLPQRDEHLEPCNLLAQALDVASVELIERQRGWEEPHRVELFGVTMPVYGAIETFSSAPYPLASCNGLCCGFSRPLGTGKVTVIGFALSYFMDVHKELIRELIGSSGPCSDVICWKRTDGRISQHTLLNIYAEPRTINLGGELIKVPAMSGMQVERPCAQPDPERLQSA